MRGNVYIMLLFVFKVPSRLIGMSRRTWGTDIHTYVITIIVRKYYTTVHIIINTALLANYRH